MSGKTTQYAARRARCRQTAGYAGAGLLLLLLVLLSGCPFDKAYHVYYEGNDNTDGFPPVDSEVYAPGDTAIVLAKPQGLKKGELRFLGWNWSGSNTRFQSGDTITIGHGDVWFYAAWEDDPNYSPYTYTDAETGGVKITKYSPYNKNDSPLVIPNNLDKKPVTVIGEGAFANAYLDSVTLPNQLQIIESKAFTGNWFETITIPDTVRSIGKLAFEGSSLRTLTLGSNLKTIDDYAFDGNYLTDLILPDSVSSLGEGAFYDNKLTTIKIGDKVTIESDTSLGTYGASFRSCYMGHNSAAGVYLYNAGSWEGPFTLTGQDNEK
jgi:hypothetical protein